MTKLIDGSYHPISTAPKDGSVIEVAAEDVGRFKMYWDKAAFNNMASRQPGLWVAEGGGLTWTEDGGYGPTHWRPVTRQ